MVSQGRVQDHGYVCLSVGLLHIFQPPVWIMGTLRYACSMRWYVHVYVQGTRAFACPHIASFVYDLDLDGFGLSDSLAL